MPAFFKMATKTDSVVAFPRLLIEAMISDLFFGVNMSAMQEKAINLKGN